MVEFFSRRFVQKPETHDAPGNEAACASGSRKSTTSAGFMVNLGGPGFPAVVVDSCGGLARPRRRAWPPLVTAHARGSAETARCRLSRPPQPTQAPTSAAPPASSPLIDQQFEVSVLSSGSVGRLCGSGDRVWSGVRSPVLVCVFSGRLCVLGLCVLLVPGTGFFVSLNFFASGGQSAAVFVRVCQHGSFVESIPCSLVPFSRSISVWLA